MIAASCGPQVDPPAAEQEVPIIGGEPDTGDPSVVALYGEGSQGGFLCTGSVIAPTVVLTAAHCVSPSETGDGARFVVLTGGNVNRSGGTQLAVREVHANPRWNPQDLQSGHDQGIVILSEPTSLRPLPIVRQSLAASSIGKSVRIVGYGLSDGTKQTGAGTKRQAVTTLRAMSADLIGIGTTQHGTCNGDSGGPAFLSIGGSEVIVGTTSFGNSNCTDGGYDARVDTDLAFIDRYLEQACKPSCGGLSCGSDGCGGSCGECGDGQTCSSAGRCESSSGCGAGGREQEPNDSALQANAVCPGGTIKGTLPDGDADWFRFTVPADATYDVTLAGGPTGAALRVYKRSASGNLTYIGDGPEVSKHTAAGGDYLARVTGGTGSTDSYTVTVHTMP